MRSDIWALRVRCSAWLSRFLDWAVRPNISTRYGVRDAYLTWQVFGIGAGVVAVLVVAHRSMLSTKVVGILCFTTVSIIVLLHRGGHRWSRHSGFVGWARSPIYHHQIIALAVAILLLLQLRQPPLPYLDALVVGWMVAQAAGRIGCLMAGCCYGRPHRWGVCYGSKHLEAGHIHYLAGVRLFPVQLLETLSLICLAGVAVLQISTGVKPGDIVAWYFIGYACVRFHLEFLRADTGRPYLRGFSEPQWIAVLISVLTVGMQLSGILVVHWWHLVLAAIPIVVMVTVTICKRMAPAQFSGLSKPLDLREFVFAARWTKGMATEFLKGETTIAPAAVSTTSLGIQLSAACKVEASGSVIQYELSNPYAPMSHKAARRLARLVGLVISPQANIAIESGVGGVFRFELAASESSGI